MIMTSILWYLSWPVLIFAFTKISIYIIDKYEKEYTDD